MGVTRRILDSNRVVVTISTKEDLAINVIKGGAVSIKTGNISTIHSSLEEIQVFTIAAGKRTVRTMHRRVARKDIATQSSVHSIPIKTTAADQTR
mmetsp:Transcript_431/g.916  ORF Transcript_431/g.916 Transcript_431/m.916 type:complete len:95 (-) Transcript_431:152-436(-)